MTRTTNDAADRAAPTSPGGSGPQTTWGSAPALRRAFLAALGAATLWWLSLALLALLTANPVTVNQEQVLEAEALVEATVLDAAQGEIRVDRVYTARQAFDAKTLRLPNLGETKAETGETYLIPLSQTATGYEVTPTALPDRRPLIYPATPEATEQLKRGRPPAPQRRP